MYADDTTYIVSDKHRTQNQLKINITLSKLEHFLTINELSINVSKTSVLETMIKQKKGKTRGDPHLVVKYPDNQDELLIIQDSSNFRLLGANLQQNMNWNQHLEKGEKAILPGIRKQLGFLKCLGGQLSFESRKLLAEGLLLSKLIYLISQWGGATQNNINKAKILMNQIARWVTKSGKKARISILLETCNWMSIQELARYHSDIQTWKILRLNNPETINDRWQLNENEEIITLKPRLKFKEDGYCWRASREWNAFPLEIRQLRSLPVFKRRIKSWIKMLRTPVPD